VENIEHPIRISFYKKQGKEVMPSALNPAHMSSGSSDFPFAPSGWDLSVAEQVAENEDLDLAVEHVELIKALQEYFHKHDKTDFNIRELHDALDERFHSRGGIKSLYKWLPGGPVAQGCRLAGLDAPAGAEDYSFGSVQ
jgi:tRNA 2-thiouridine synthesizing protein E